MALFSLPWTVLPFCDGIVILKRLVFGKIATKSPIFAFERTQKTEAMAM